MIGFFRSNKSITYNFDKWLSGEKRLLFIIGLSGSGKSTMAKQVSLMNDAECLGLDQYIKKLIRTKTGQSNPDYEKEAFEQGVKLLVEDNPKGQLVIEGGQLLWFNPEDLKNEAVIIVRTSLVVSCWRACKRDFDKDHWEKYGTISPQTHVGINVRDFRKMKMFSKEFV